MKQLTLLPRTYLFFLLLFGFTAGAQQKLASSMNNRSESSGATTVALDKETAGATEISPLDAFKSEKEDFSKRDLYSKHYVNEDGSYTALIGAGPIHYEKNGQFLDIDHNITRQSDSQFPYANTTNLFESYFGSTSHTGVKNKTAEGEIVEFLNTKMYWEVNGQPVNQMASANVAVTIDGDRAYYNNLYGTVSAEFFTLTGKRKLNYIIPNRQALANPAHAEYLVFAENIQLPQGWSSKTEENGILITDASGKHIYLYENPVSTDASNNLSREQNTIFETVLNGNILTILTKVKTDWLLNNDRQFPVKVDPTVNANSSFIRCVYNDGFEEESGDYFGRVDGYWLNAHVKYNVTSVPAGSIVNSTTSYVNLINIHGDYHSSNAFRMRNSLDPETNQGTSLYNSANTNYSNNKSITQLGLNNVILTAAGNSAVQSALGGYISLTIQPAGSYYTTDYYSINNLYLTIDYTPQSNPIDCNNPLTGLTASIGNPANGLNHHLDLNWDVFPNATGYDVEYSTNGSSFTSAGSVTTNYANLNAGDNPNAPYWLRVRAKGGSTLCNWTTIGPIYTAADNPALPLLSNVSGSTVDINIAAETPVANPANTEYAIYSTTTELYLQADGSMGATEIWQTKANWGTTTVTGLIGDTEYCFYAKARNQDGHEVGGNSSFLTETFDSNILHHGGTGPDNNWFAPNSQSPISWNASYGCPSGGGGIGYSTTGSWGNFVRTPVQDFTGLDEVTMTFDLTNSYSANRPNDKIYFNMYAGSYINATSVNGVATHELIFDQLRTCEKITVKYDLSGITNKSEVFLYFNAGAGSGSGTFSFEIDNVTILEPSETACITTANALTPIFHNYGGDVQLAFNNSRIDTENPVFRLSHSENVANTYEVEINTSPDFSLTGVTQEFIVDNPANTEINVSFNNGFTPSSGTTYYVRARAKEATGPWSSWTTGTYSFTNQLPQETPDWFQTTRAQFETDNLSGATANSSNDVTTGGAGGNLVINGDFATGNTTNWTKVGTSGSARVVDVVNNADPTKFPGQWLRMGSPNFGVGSGGTGTIVVSQEVDLTNVAQITFKSGNYFNVGSPFDPMPNTKAEFKIGGTLNDNAGTVEKTIIQQGSGQGYTYYRHDDSTIDVSGYTGIQVIKFVMTYVSSWNGNGSVVFYFDDITANVNPSGTITSTPIHLASVQDAGVYEGITWNQTLNGGDLTLTVQGSTDGVSFSDIPGFTNMSETGDGEKTIDLSGMTEVPAHVRLVGTLDGAGVKLHDWSVQFGGLPDPTYDFTYINDIEQWEPNYPGNPTNPSSSEHTIGILEGTAVFNNNIVAKDLTVNPGANLNVEKVLKLHGDIVNNGLITFKSSSVQNTAQFDEFDGDITGTGRFTTERFIPARRSYRFLSPSVSTDENIYINWQENGRNDAGLGTHITGANPTENGFDPTGTNNPSMFLLDEAAQAWTPIANTNVEKLTAGNPYLIMVRGDRNTDLTNNNATPSPTILRATGDLEIGDVTFTAQMLTENQEFFIGNPYQASVSIEQLLLGAANIKLNHYHLYNPQMGGANGIGSYVAVDLDFGWESTPESEANGYLQPGQAILVKANGNGIPKVIFRESFKSVDEPLTNTFRSTISRIALHLYNEDDYIIGQTPVDGISVKFSENGNNGIDDYDTPKMGNINENLAIRNDDRTFSIESRAYPNNNEIIPLSIKDYRQTRYTFEAKLNILPEQTTIYLYDTYTNIYTEISAEAPVSYNFDVDPGIEASYSSDRFDIRFIVGVTGIDDLISSSMVIYPNPFDGNFFQISANGLAGQTLEVQVVNMLGQSVYSGNLTVAPNGLATVTLAEDISSGIYNVKIVTKDNHVINKKLIKN